MTIAYNYLNLPKTVTKGSDVLTYIYDATGSKLAAKLNSTVNNFYTGAVVYKGDKTIDYIPASTGLIRKVGADFVRQYNINDHLGNVRAVVNQSGTIEQASDYYPYGLAFNYNNLDKNRYLYNGKELQNQTLATTFFGVYDYGVRHYDPVIGRWNSVDPMGEKYYNISSYNYAANNPLLFIDINGEGPLQFLKSLASSVTAAITVGIQGGVEVKVAGQPAVSLYGNAGSKDLIGVRGGNLTHIAQENSPTRYGTSIGIGSFGTSTEAEVVKTTQTEIRPILGTNSKIPIKVDVEKGTKTTSISAFGITLEGTQKAEIRTDKSTGQRNVKTTEPTLSTVKMDIGSKLDIKASAIVGIDVSVDIKKVIEAFREL